MVPLMKTHFFACVLGLAGVLCAGGALGQTSVVSGTVVTPEGGPVAGAQVFVEPGLAGDLLPAEADASGAFRFEGAFSGETGVFAFAEGRAFGGQHLNLALGEEVGGLRIVLDPPAAVSGKVTDEKNTPLAGARITRVALTHGAKVGIPLSKLAPFGVREPVTDAEGRFTVTGLPAGGRIALKVGHPDHAQEAVEDVSPGDTNVSVRLSRGILVRGMVRLRRNQSPVSGALVLARSGLPPHDTSLATTDGFGAFTLRLRPGAYLAQATASGQSTPGWQLFTVTGETPEVSVNLGLAGTGTIRGAIADAAGGKGIPGARIRLESHGNIAAVVRSGMDGTFSMAAAEGENTLFFESTPGYLPPEPRGVRVAVVAGGDLELPGVWLAPLPVFRVQVLEEDEETPVPGAVVSLLRPRQFGWLAADAEGWVEIRIGGLPEDGRIYGTVQHPLAPKGAVFALDRAAARDTAVKLLPLASLRGRLVDGKGKPLANTLVGAAFADASPGDPLLLWRTATDKTGAFRWNALVPGVPQRIAVAGAGDVAPEKAVQNPAPGADTDLGDLTVSGAPAVGGAVPVERDKLGAFQRVCGPAVTENKPLVAVFCEAGEAQAVVEGLQNALSAADLLKKWQPVVVVRGGHACDSGAVSVHAGGPGEAGGTVLYDTEGRVLLRTSGLPPLSSLTALP